VGRCQSEKLCDRVTDLAFSFTYRLAPEPAQVGYAREWVRKILPSWGLAEHDHLVALIVGELVTNSLLHSKDPIEVALSYGGTELLIQVRDSGDEMPIRRNPGHGDESGRGLQLIDGLIDIVGGTRGADRQSGCRGKVVYVSLPVRSWQPFLIGQRSVDRLCAPNPPRAGMGLLPRASSPHLDNGFAGQASVASPV
jgi:anti-sigma regulatory factor (Ser/Thr protein kinase)